MGNKAAAVAGRPILTARIVIGMPIMLLALLAVMNRSTCPRNVILGAIILKKTAMTTVKTRLMGEMSKFVHVFMAALTCSNVCPFLASAAV